MDRHARVDRRTACLIVLAALSIPACAGSIHQPYDAAIQPTYDESTGRLRELAYDANGDGRTDTWVDMDGTRALESRVDLDGDGRIDRWEHYDEAGTLARVGFSRRNDGRADAWACPGPDGRLSLIEISSTYDPSAIDRREYYDPDAPSPAGQGALVRAEEDSNGDGRMDKWETYEGGAIRSVAFDETGNGIPDRRLVFSGTVLSSIESEPDASGRFTRRVRIQ